MFTRLFVLATLICAAAVRGGDNDAPLWLKSLQALPEHEAERVELRNVPAVAADAAAAAAAATSARTILESTAALHEAHTVAFSAATEWYRDVLFLSDLVADNVNGEGEIARFLPPPRLKAEIVSDDPLEGLTDLARKGLFFLHFPKVANFFYFTIFGLYCPAMRFKDYPHQCRPDEVQNLEKYSPSGFRKCDANQVAHYNFLIQYSPEAWCKERLFAPLRLHRPLDMQRERALDRPVVAMFREPRARILSAYLYARAAVSMHGPQWGELLENVRTPRDFAQLPGVGGCYARMLTGQQCAHTRMTRVPDAQVQRAKHIVQHELAFVGLAERWRPSICLFHALFGGTVEPFELRGEREQDAANDGNSSGYDVAQIELHRHDADAEIYELAVQRFNSMLEQHHVSISKCLDTIRSFKN